MSRPQYATNKSIEYEYYDDEESFEDKPTEITTTTSALPPSLSDNEP